MSVVYGLVARQALVLAEFSTTDVENVTTARKLICKVDASPFTKTYVQGNLLYSFHTKDGVSYMCIADQSVGRELSVRFLEELERGFQTYHDRAAEYSKAIKSLLDKYHYENLPSLDPLTRIERDLNRVVETTKGNLGKVVTRGTQMEELKAKTEQLNMETKKLRSIARDHNYSHWKKKVKIYALVLGMWVGLGYYCYTWVGE